MEWNLHRSVELIDCAAERNPDLIYFSESVLDGYSGRSPDLPDLARPVPGPETDRVAEAARRHGVWICWSLAESVDGAAVCNTSLLFDRSGEHPSCHTNPIFVIVDDRPVRSLRRSAEWCRKAVDQCWEMKRPAIRDEERAAAAEAYEVARQYYDREAVAD